MTALQSIEEGKFYRTRDGRKVGPMLVWNWHSRWPWSDDESDGTDIWDDYGCSGVPDTMIVAEWTDEHETGTLAELNVKPGDRWEMVENEVEELVGDTGTIDKSGIAVSDTGGGYRPENDEFYGRRYRIVSRASQSDTPKLLKEMTDAEIGALVRAHKEGKVIQAVGGGRSEWIDCDPQWRWDWAYRIRPEPVRETVALTSFDERAKGHRITFDLIDGKPDITSIRMEEL